MGGKPFKLFYCGLPFVLLPDSFNNLVKNKSMTSVRPKITAKYAPRVGRDVMSDKISFSGHDVVAHLPDKYFHFRMDIQAPIFFQNGSLEDFLSLFSFWLVKL